MGIVTALALFLLIVFAIWREDRRFDEVVAHLERLERGGVLVSMDRKKILGEDVSPRLLTITQKRHLLEKASAARAVARAAK